jgi:hypothetical protein
LLSYSLSRHPKGGGFLFPYNAVLAFFLMQWRDDTKKQRKTIALTSLSTMQSYQFSSLVLGKILLAYILPALCLIYSQIPINIQLD